MTTDQLSSLRVALVHDWLTGTRGGERCLEALIEILPKSEIFTLVHRKGRVSSTIESLPVHTSFVDRLPFARTHHRYYLPWFPIAIERFDLSDFDLVISLSHCVAKGAQSRGGARHLCYCFTPMRYVWDHYDQYFGRAALPVRLAGRLVADSLRRWDVRTATRAHAFVACSRNIQRKISKFYGRDSQVVYPPVAIERFRFDRPREDFYLVVSALVPYKRIDIAVDAFSRMGRRLLVVGEGTEYRQLRKRAGPSVTFTGRLADEEVADLLSRCRGFVFPGEEDFGITPVEAQAAGAPVMAFKSGGVLESVRGLDLEQSETGGATGVLFSPQQPDALIAAVDQLEAYDFDPRTLRRNAERFRTERFQLGIRNAVEDLLGADLAAVI